MGYDVAREEIKRSRTSSMPSWATTPLDRAMYAVRHSEMNTVLVNGEDAGSAPGRGRPF
jgi:hypothetical protein